MTIEPQCNIQHAADGAFIVTNKYVAHTSFLYSSGLLCLEHGRNSTVRLLGPEKAQNELETGAQFGTHEVLRVMRLQYLVHERQA
jgi:hypothetical protein